MSARLGSGSVAIDPFWNRLRAITRYPLHWSAMIPIVALGLAHLLVFIPFGFVLVLFATVAMYRYAFDCLRATADGQMEPPGRRWSDDRTVGWQFIGLIIVLVVFASVCFAFLGPRAGLVVLLLLGFALPSATITLAMMGKLSAALNPMIWVMIITRIGWPYLAAVGLCLVVFFSESYAQRWVADVMPVYQAIILIAIISNYALVVTFHLMGYLVYQYHGALGFKPKSLQVAESLQTPDPVQDVLDEAAALVRDGKPDEATARLRNHLNSHGGGTAAVHRQYRRLLRLVDDKEGLLRHGRAYMNILLAQGEDHAALELLRECRVIDPKFAPTEAEQVSKMARLAVQRGHVQLALQLLSGFHKRFPDHPDVVANYLLAATLMHEHLNQDEKARALLLNLKSNFPDTPLMPQIEERLGLIEQMLATVGSAKS